MKRKSGYEVCPICMPRGGAGAPVRELTDGRFRSPGSAGLALPVVSPSQRNRRVHGSSVKCPRQALRYIKVNYCVISGV